VIAPPLSPYIPYVGQYSPSDARSEDGCELSRGGPSWGSGPHRYRRL